MRPGATAKGKHSVKPRRSKLAEEKNISAEEEAEIKAAWEIFALYDVASYEDEKEGVIRSGDVSRAMKSAVPSRRCRDGLRL